MDTLQIRTMFIEQIQFVSSYVIISSILENCRFPNKIIYVLIHNFGKKVI